MKTRILKQKIVDFRTSDNFTSYPSYTKWIYSLLFKFVMLWERMFPKYTMPRISEQAKCLSFSFFFAIIPFFALISGFFLNIEQQNNVFQETVAQLFPKDTDAYNQVCEFVTNLISEINTKWFITSSIVLLLLPICFFFSDLENVMQSIWFMNSPRNFTRRLKAWGVGFVVTILLTLFAYMLSKSENVFFTNKLVLILLMIAIVYCSIIMIYVSVPKTKVEIKNTLLPAILPTIMLMILPIGISYYSSAPSVVIYEAFAFIPLILILTHFFFYTLLLGACMCFINQNHEDEALQRKFDKNEFILSEINLLSIFILNNIKQHTQSLVSISQKNHMPFKLVRSITNQWVHAKVVEYKINNKVKEVSFVNPNPQKDLTFGDLSEYINCDSIIAVPKEQLFCKFKFLLQQNKLLGQYIDKFYEIFENEKVDPNGVLLSLNLIETEKQNVEIAQPKKISFFKRLKNKYTLS